MSTGALNTHELRLLLRRELLAVEGLPPEDRRAWENRKFDPPTPDRDSIWTRETFQVYSEIRSSSGYVQAEGVYIVDVFCAVGYGTELADTLSQAIVSKFKASTSLQSDDGLSQVSLFRSSRQPGRPDPGPSPVWFMIPVVVSWRTFTQVAQEV